MNRRWMLAAITAASLLPLAARADMVRFHANLNGTSQVPPVTTQAIGTMTGVLDTKTDMLTYEITYMNLSGPPAAAHFHGPAAAGANGGVAAPIAAPLDSPIKGSIKLSDAQIADLSNGMWYVNIHTKQHPSGELRGQVTKGDLAK